MQKSKCVQMIKCSGYDEFKSIQSERLPVVLKDNDIGPCKQLWNSEYMSKAGGNKTVTIHISSQSKMDFVNKNFQYKTLAFNEFIKRVSSKEQNDFFISKYEMYYLRSLGENQRKDVADIKKDFPKLAADINFPPFYQEEEFFSSVFRIASEGLQLWTHYDIMDNLLMVISGRKRVVLFDPKDALYLYLNGDKSEVLDIDNPDLEKFPDFIKATRYECTLEAGDILFIPALWFHNVINEKWGVAVNVFWKNLHQKYYDPKDIYGNKDLLPAVHAMQAVERALKHLTDLPEEYKDFYGRRLIQKITDKALLLN